MDPLIKDWPTICHFKYNHNHAIETAAALQHRDLGEESREILCSLFRKGHSPSSALHCLKTDLLLKYGDEYFKVAADGFYVPSMSITSKLFQKEFSLTYGSMDGPEMFQNLQNLLKEYSLSSGKADFRKTADGHYFAVLLTPIMLRAHDLKQSEELVLLDASGGVDKQRHRIYFLVTPTSAGGLPLGVIITDTEMENVFHEALAHLKAMLGPKAFHGKGFPAVFLTDNDLKERKPLGKLYPQSKLLLCQFHVLKAVWSWLCNKNNSINSNDRQPLYFFLKNIMYAETEEKLFETKELMVSSCFFQKYEKFMKYFQYLWDQRYDWASCYRQGLPLRGTNTTNYVEVVFRILKDCILNRVMAFNLTQLVDFILTQYENYMQKRLIDFSNGRLSKSLLNKMLPVKNSIPDKDIKVIDGSTHCYTVRSQTCREKEYFVDIMNAVCSCFEGQSGKICKHASAIIFRLSEEITTGYNLICNYTKEQLFYVATGNSVSADWFMPLNGLSKATTNNDNQIKKKPEACVMNYQNSNKESDEVVPQDHEGVIQSDAKMAQSEGLTDSELMDYQNSNNESDEVVPQNHEAVLQRDAKIAQSEGLTDSELMEFDNLIERIKNGYRKEPGIFAPAIKKMLKNAKVSAATQSGLVSALCTFGLYRGAGKRSCRQSHHGQNIGVQPTSISRRKSFLSGKRKLSAGRPSNSTIKFPKALHGHDYTSLGSLPSRKNKSTHNLQDCVYNNKSLGGKKHGNK